MSEEVQEIRQVMTWDTTDAESGAVRMERAFGRLEKAEKQQVERSAQAQKNAKPPGAHGGHGAHSGASDFGMGVHDALMGRTAAAMFRFGNAAKLAGTYAVGMNLALEAGEKAWDYAQKDIEKTTLAAERLEASFLKVSKAAAFATVGEGSGKLSGTFEALEEQRKAGKVQEKDLSDQRALLDQGTIFSGNWRSPFGAGLFRVADWWREKKTGLGQEGLQRQNDLEMAIVERQQVKARRLYTGALTREADSAQDRLGGDTFSAQRRDLAGKQEAEIAEARSKGLGGDDNLAQIRRRYAVEQAGNDKAERAADRQLETEGKILELTRQGGAVQAATARARLEAADAAVEAEVVGTRAWHEKKQASRVAAVEVATIERGDAMARADYRQDVQVAGFAGNASSRSAMQAQAEVDKAREHLRILQTAVGVRATEKELNEANLRLVSAQTAQEMLQRQQYQQRADVSLDQGVAGFGGNEDERAALAAETEVEKAREHLALARSVKGANEADLEVMQAKLEVSRALLAQELQRRAQLAAQRELTSAVWLAPGAVRAAGARLEGASPEEAQRATLSAHVDAAAEAYENARKRAIEEKNSVASLQAQTAAARELAQAQLAVALHDQQIRRDRALAMESVQGETASLRFGAAGRDDLAELTSQRTQSSVAIQRANLAGHPEEAAELAEQQRLRERKQVHSLYLNEDGTRRNPFDVQSEMHERRVKQTRVAQFDKALDRNGGLLSVGRDMAGNITSGVDPLTGQRLNAREIAARNGAAKAGVDQKIEQMGDHEVFANILKTLMERLPQASP